MLQRRAFSSSVERRSAVSSRPAGRCLSVQVFAKKGKGKGVIRQSAGVPGLAGSTGPGAAQQQVMVDAKVPEIDPEQVEWVLFVKGTNVPSGKITIKETQWMPMSIMRGGPAGTTLSKLMETGFGRKLYSNLLIRQIGQSLYKDKDNIASSIRKGYPPMAGVATKDIKFAFKVRDKTKPESWKDATDLVLIPPESEVQGTGFDSVKEFFSTDNLSKLFSN